MAPTYLIVLREAFEAALLLGIAYTYLQKIARPGHYRYVTWGAVLGVLASAGVGVAVTYLSGPLRNSIRGRTVRSRRSGFLG